MLYGIVTHLSNGIGVIGSNNRVFRFSIVDFPEAAVGMQVTFDPENVSNESDTWVSSIQNVGLSPMKDILQRLEKIEERITALEISELPENYVRRLAEDESA